MNVYRSIAAGVLCVGALVWSAKQLNDHYTQLRHFSVGLGGVGVMPAVDPDTFRPFQVVPPFPAITNAPVRLASSVTDQVSDSELVLGLELNGEARAYPINMLTGPDREIINDRLGGVAIAATW